MFCPRCHRELPGEYRFCPFDGAATAKVPALDRVKISPTRWTDEMLADRYVIRGFVGRGGMARVYLAEDVDSGRAVAIKVLERPYADDTKACERFLGEARTVGLIGHRHIVNILETGRREADGAPYLVMEYLFGETLGTYLERERTMPVDIVMRLAKQAASALGAAHDKGVVHRDVKPDNLFLLGEPGDPYELKIIDFGLSKLQRSDLTAAGVVMGTPKYMAPEQVLGEAIDARADVYALGMVLYRALVGRCPFEGYDDVDTIAHQLHALPAPPASFAPGLDRRVEALVRAAIRKRPDARYRSMWALLDDLDALDDPGEPLWAERPMTDEPYEPTTDMGRMVARSLRPLVETPPVAATTSADAPEISVEVIDEAPPHAPPRPPPHRRPPAPGAQVQPEQSPELAPAAEPARAALASVPEPTTEPAAASRPARSAARRRRAKKSRRRGR